MDSTAEQLLLERIRNSDDTAFKTLHDLYYRPLYELALKKLGDEDDAYDLVQEMFIELWEKRAGFIINNPLYNYLKNRLWFKLSAHFRKKGFLEKHLLALTTFFEQEQEAEVVDTDPQELQQLELQYDLLLSQVEVAIEKMPVKMKAVFLLSRTGEYSITEIAEKLSISPKTVSNQVNMAMDRIRRALANQGLSAMEILILIWLTKN